ncbi:MAG: tryptophan 2,3-dioxygenase family protein [Actinomycetota bacterium]|nr:tryptophan 2,3-dioxygenase family protein [Actinomycetota bacterium]
MDSDLTYGEYLRLGELLGLQRPRSRPEHHDELLFIVMHQTCELWFEVVRHELSAVSSHLEADEARPAFKSVARVKSILHSLTDQWAVLATLTPADYAGFRSALATSSGFQSYQYRAIELALGAKDRSVVERAGTDPLARSMLADGLARPSLYDQFLRWLARRGHPVPADVLGRDVTESWTFTPSLLPVLRVLYERTDAHWVEYECCEELVDLEDSFRLWRFRHLQTVERIIGTKPGTGGSDGVGYLRSAVDRRFFPELFAIRAELG